MGGNACLLLHLLSDSKLQTLVHSCRLLQALAGSCRLVQTRADSCRLVQARAGSCRLVQARAVKLAQRIKISRGSTFHDLGKRDRASFGTWQNPLGKKSGFLPFFDF